MIPTFSMLASNVSKHAEIFFIETEINEKNWVGFSPQEPTSFSTMVVYCVWKNRVTFFVGLEYLCGHDCQLEM